MSNGDMAAWMLLAVCVSVFLRRYWSHAMAVGFPVPWRWSREQWTAVGLIGVLWGLLMGAVKWAVNYFF